jgi:hypothetical protein
MDPDTIHGMLADRSVGSYPASLLSQPMKQGGVSQALDGDQLLGLSDHITGMRSVRSILAHVGQPNGP